MVLKLLKSAVTDTAPSPLPPARQVLAAHLEAVEAARAKCQRLQDQAAAVADAEAAEAAAREHLELVAELEAVDWRVWSAGAQSVPPAPRPAEREAAAAELAETHQRVAQARSVAAAVTPELLAAGARYRELVARTRGLAVAAAAEEGEHLVERYIAAATEASRLEASLIGICVGFDAAGAVPAADRIRQAMRGDGSGLRRACLRLKLAYTGLPSMLAENAAAQIEEIIP